MNTKTTTRVCIHCGTPFQPVKQRVDFCCSGCQFVHGLIVKNGLGQFYDLQRAAGVPVKSSVFQKRDYSWLADMVKTAEREGGPVAALELDLQGVSCIGCVWLVETVFSQKPGALSIQASHGAGRLHLRWQSGTCDVVEFARTLQSFGYSVSPPGKSAKNGENRALATRIGVCAAFAMNTMLFTLPGYLGMRQSFEYAPLFGRLALAFSTLSFVVGGGYFFTRSWHSLRNRVLHIDLPISIGLAAAYAGSLYAYHSGRTNFVYFDFVSVFVLLMLTGRWIQQAAVEKNRNQLPGGQTFIKDSDRDLKTGDTYAVERGSVVPVRSILLSAEATLGLEWINGEAETRDARAGQVVPSGAVNFSAETVQLEAAESWRESILSKLVEAAPRDHSRNTLLERFIKYYILVVIAVAAAGFAGWFAATGELLQAVQVLISVLVVSCPCAAGIALPLADEMAVSGLRRFGVFVREQGIWARIVRVRRIIFDKTGTLTLETLALREPEALLLLAREHQQALLHLVADSLHPVSGCLREYLLAAGVSENLDAEVEEIAGCGLTMQTEEGTWRVGRPAWAATGREAGRSDGAHECAFMLNGNVLACFSFTEEVRCDAVEEVIRLQKEGYAIHILSGDRAHKVAGMARLLGLPAGQCESELSPADKARRLRALDRNDTLMIGDGANDSLAFNESWCSGTPAIGRGLLEQKSDFYFLGRGINGVRQLLETGKRRRRTVRRVVAFTLAYNACVIAVSLAGRMNPLAAAVLMPLSSLVSIVIVGFGLASRRSAAFADAAARTK